MRSTSRDERAGLRRVWGSFNMSNSSVIVAGSGDWVATRTQAGRSILWFPPFASTPVCEGISNDFGVIGFAVVDLGQIQANVWVPNTGAGLDAAVLSFEFRGR